MLYTSSSFILGFDLLNVFQSSWKFLSFSIFLWPPFPHLCMFKNIVVSFLSTNLFPVILSFFFLIPSFLFVCFFSWSCLLMGFLLFLFHWLIFFNFSVWFLRISVSLLNLFSTFLNFLLQTDHLILFCQLSYLALELISQFFAHLNPLCSH